jgi:hypothetical protein
MVPHLVFHPPAHKEVVQMQRNARGTRRTLRNRADRRTAASHQAMLALALELAGTHRR